MRRLRYRLLDVFTNWAFGVNQLAVFTDVSGLSSQTMQSIARELNLSETTFVLQPDDRATDYRVRIFAPTVELPMAGHPTIGTSFVLAMDRLVERSERISMLKLEEGVGIIPVSLKWENGHPAFKAYTATPSVCNGLADSVLSPGCPLDLKKILLSH